MSAPAPDSASTPDFDRHSEQTDRERLSLNRSSPGTGVGQSIHAADARWNFSGDVAQTFDEHVQKSVPFYNEGHDLVTALSDFFLYEGAVTYELGCSTGALTRKLAERNGDRSVTMIGLEIEPNMVAAAEQATADYRGVEIREANILEAELEPADLIVAYYTVQFIRPAQRQALLDKIYASLKWGGALIMFEKVRAADARFQDMMTLLYHDHKLAQGFSEHEVVHKSRSLKGVLEPFSSQANRDMIQRAGFVDQMSVFKYLCFEGFLAVK